MKDLEVYENEIDIYADDYIKSLANEEDIYKVSTFKGMLKHIFKHVFKAKKSEKTLYQLKTNIDTSDIDTINEIWDIYTSLCYKYNHNPSLLGFSLLTGINDDTFNSWRTGEVRASSGHSAAVKRWKKECELALADRTSEQNSVGSMFLLKSCYGYSKQLTSLTRRDCQKKAGQRSQRSMQSINNYHRNQIYKHNIYIIKALCTIRQ